ncbi:MAG: hypothetical protein ACREFX_05345 [Opitutaceae bacterium]
MSILRFILNLLTLAIVVAGILLAVAFIPQVQTFIAQKLLGDHPGYQASWDTLSAGFGKAAIGNLHIVGAGADLTAPSVHATLPITIAVLRRDLRIRTLVVKGWTLDLQGAAASWVADVRRALTPGAGGTLRSLGSVRLAPETFRGLLRSWSLPCDLDLARVDLEGDVLLPPIAVGRGTTRVHVIITGGGLASGREGGFDIRASAAVVEPDMSVMTLRTHGRLVAAMSTPRVLDRLEYRGGFSVRGGPFPGGLAITGDFAVADAAPGAEAYRVRVFRGTRPLARIAARLPGAGKRIEGTWAFETGNADLGPFLSLGALPSFSAAGQGTFDTDPEFRRVHAAGRLSAAARGLGVLLAPLDALGPVRIAARFEADQSGHSVRIRRLDVSLDGPRPKLIVRLLQPMEADERSGELRASDPAADAAVVSFRAVPLSWASGFAGTLALSAGKLTGDCLVRPMKNGFEVHSRAPLAGTGVTVLRRGQVLARNVDLSLGLVASESAGAWGIQATPLTIGRGGRRWFTLKARASQPSEADQPIAVAGSWTADLQAIAAANAVAGRGRIGGRSASGHFFANFGTDTAGDATLTAVGRDPRRTLSVSVHADEEGPGYVSFDGPVKLALDGGISDLDVDGKWISDEEGRNIYATVTGGKVDLEHLRVLAASLLAATGGAPAELAGAAGKGSSIPDRTPFWGGLSGEVKVQLASLKAGASTLTDVTAGFGIGRRFIRLEQGRAALAPKHFANVTGSLTFDPGAALPYRVKATASVARVEAGPLFPSPDKGGDPLIEGRFDVTANLDGNGANLPDLIRRTREELRIDGSTGGIVRVLATDVAEAIPESKTTVGDDLGRVGSTVGRMFGVQKKVYYGLNRLSPDADAVLRFVDEISEMSCDRIGATAVVEPDGAIRIERVTAIAGDERVEGSGRIAAADGLPWRARPLNLNLRLWARRATARWLGTAGLLSSQKDGEGYTLFAGPIHLGGTVQHIDKSGWHAVLVKAALQKPAQSAKKRI